MMYRRSKFSSQVFLTLLSVALFVLCGLTSLTKAQQPNQPITGREPACGCYCGYPNYESFDISPCTSRLREDACEDNMKQMPPEQFRSVCRRMQAKLKTRSDEYPCKKLFNRICPAACEDVSCYCGYDADKGFAYTPGTANGRSAPSKSAPTVAKLSSGGRFLYRSTKIVDGETWFEIAPPGMQGGTVWVPGSELSCRRPVPPPVPKPTTINDSGPDVAKCTSAQTAGSRG